MCVIAIMAAYIRLKVIVIIFNWCRDIYIHFNKESIGI